MDPSAGRSGRQATEARGPVASEVLMQPNASRRVRRVLVVDDELEFAILMNDVLATLPEPLNVEIAGNGRDAVEAVRRAAPDLVMLDVNMPVMNGLDALRHIRELDPKLPDRKSTRLNSSHGYISYAVFCLKKKKKHEEEI